MLLKFLVLTVLAVLFCLTQGDVENLSFKVEGSMSSCADETFKRCNDDFYGALGTIDNHGALGTAGAHLVQ